MCLLLNRSFPWLSQLSRIFTPRQTQMGKINDDKTDGKIKQSNTYKSDCVSAGESLWGMWSRDSTDLLDSWWCRCWLFSRWLWTEWLLPVQSATREPEAKEDSFKPWGERTRSKRKRLSTWLKEKEKGKSGRGRERIIRWCPSHTAPVFTVSCIESDVLLQKTSKDFKRSFLKFKAKRHTRILRRPEGKRVNGTEKGFLLYPFSKQG